MIEEGKLVSDPKARAKVLVHEFKWDVTEARNIWTFGPEGSGPNVVVDCTRAVQYLNETKDSITSAFEWVTKEGVLAEEKMRGVKFSIMDALFHRDSAHRGSGQVSPAARKVFYAAQLTAKPNLYEPVYLVDIQCPAQAMSGIYNCLSKRRGEIVETVPKIGGIHYVKAYLPVAESFGFTEHLRSETSGKAFPQCSFDHWQLLTTDPMEPHSKAFDLILSIRKRKGLPQELPNLSKYLDKL